MIRNLRTHPAPYVRICEVMRYFAVNRLTVRKWIEAGLLVKVTSQIAGGKLTRVTRASLQRFEREQWHRQPSRRRSRMHIL